MCIHFHRYDGSKKEGTLQVDKNEAKKQSSKGNLVGIGLSSSEFYIGGLKPGKKINTNAGGKEVPTFDGCIKDLEINNKEIKFTEPGLCVKIIVVCSYI